MLPHSSFRSFERSDLKINHYKSKLQIKNQFLLSYSYKMAWVKNFCMNRFNYNLDGLTGHVRFFGKFYKEISFWGVKFLVNFILEKSEFSSIKKLI